MNLNHTYTTKKNENITDEGDERKSKRKVIIFQNLLIVYKSVYFEQKTQGPKVRVDWQPNVILQ